MCKTYWRGDVTRLSQILNNLVGNAIKFTDSGSVDIYISLDIEDPNRVMFEVADTGAGIKADEQQCLFDAFSQTESGRNKKRRHWTGARDQQKYFNRDEW